MCQKKHNANPSINILGHSGFFYLLYDYSAWRNVINAMVFTNQNRPAQQSTGQELDIVTMVIRLDLGVLHVYFYMEYVIDPAKSCLTKLIIHLSCNSVSRSIYHVAISAIKVFLIWLDFQHCEKDSSELISGLD